MTSLIKWCAKVACQDYSPSIEAEVDRIWKFCPKCGEPLIIWNIEEVEP